MTTLDSIKAQIDQISALAYHHADPEDCDAAKASLLSEIEELFSQLDVQAGSIEAVRAEPVVYADKSDLLELAGANGMSVWCESRNIWGNPGDPPLSKRLTPLYAAPQAAQSVWLPIESAPQDKAVDLWCKSTSNPAYGRRVTSVCLVGDDWYGANLPNPSFGEYASHWMALPSPPDSLVKN